MLGSLFSLPFKMHADIKDLCLQRRDLLRFLVSLRIPFE